ncbi:MAG TPA: HAD family phosphatase [Chloroflexota bacterium]|nr:HAD family phosphatase [Chloroflexota bacterium]
MSDPGRADLKIEAGIFDVGGVLISNQMAHVWRDVLETLQLEEPVFRTAWREMGPALGSGQLEEAEFWRGFLERTGATGRLPEESLFVREYGKRWSVHQAVMDLVARLKGLGLKTAVLSNTITAHVSHNREKGLYAPFDVLVFSNEVGLSKPDPAIYRHTLEQLGLQDRPEATFFVDDLEENVDAARALGMHGILFEDAQQLVEDVRALGVPV